MIAILALISVGGVFATMAIERKSKDDGLEKAEHLWDPVTSPSVMPTVAPALVPAVQITAPVVGPAVPPEGIPAGWTMEQWNHYGQQWLVDQGRV